MQCIKCRAKSLCGALEINQNCSAMQCKTHSAHVTKVVDAVQCDAMRCDAVQCDAKNAGLNLSVELWKLTRTAVQCKTPSAHVTKVLDALQCYAMRCDAVQCNTSIIFIFKKIYNMPSPHVNGSKRGATLISKFYST